MPYGCGKDKRRRAFRSRFDCIPILLWDLRRNTKAFVERRERTSAVTWSESCNGFMLQRRGYELTLSSFVYAHI